MQLRPYRIAAEIDEMFNGAKLTGIGVVNFLGCNQIILNDEFAGLTLMYDVTHGGEDKNFNEDGHGLIGDEDQYIRDFEEQQKHDKEDDGFSITDGQ